MGPPQDADDAAHERAPLQYHDDATSISSDETIIYTAPGHAGTTASTAHLIHNHNAAGTTADENEDDDEEGNPTSSRILPHLPRPLRRAALAIGRWARGPRPPRIWRIEPFCPRVQDAPVRLLDWLCPRRKQKVLLLLGTCVLWFGLFALVLGRSAFAGDVPGYGAPKRMGCTSRFWRDKNGCGLDGDLCRPFTNVTVPFRCPANCKRVEVVNPHAVGDQEVNYQPLVIGGATEEHPSVGDSIYRGDSFICGAGIHAGFVSNKQGGCGVLRLVGEHTDYPSTKSHGIKSIGFDSYFPLSFTFVEGTQAQCRDLRWPLFAVSLTFTVLVSLFTTSPAVFFPLVFVGVYFHVALASDPPTFSDYYAIVSTALGRFLPAAFCAYAIYVTAVRRTLTGLRAQIEKTVLWLGACWVGAFNNYTFDKIPIQRLTPHDIRAQPGAVPALIIIVLGIFLIALGQAWALRVEGRFIRYLAIYGTMGAGLLALVCVPGMHVRIHHYILALLLLPGTSMQTRPSLLYQGLLVGLFINGIARWGFDSILQTPLELHGDAPWGTPLPHLPHPPIIHPNLDRPDLPPNITFLWSYPLPHAAADGLSILVNDVERFRGYADRGQDRFTWVRRHEEDHVPEYFRFAYVKGRATWDYTKAGVWEGEGGWREPGRGPSLVADGGDGGEDGGDTGEGAEGGEGGVVDVEVVGEDRKRVV